jgi:ABC-type multidrug transport system fused ATPase/permease subunit
LPGDLVRGLARTLPWTWRPGSSGSANGAYLTTLFVLAAGLVVARGVLLYLTNRLAALTGRSAAVRARRSVYQHGFRLSALATREADRDEVADLLTRRAEHLRDGLTARYTDAVRATLAAGLLGLVVLLVHPWAGAAVLFLAAVVWLVAGQAAAYFRREARVAGRRAEARLGLMAEAVAMTPLVRSYLMDRFSQSRFERHLTDLNRATRQRERGELLSRPALATVAALAGFVFLYLAARMVLAGDLSVAGLVTLGAALGGLVFAVNRMVLARQRVRRARAAAAGIGEFLDRRGDTGQPLDAEFLQPVTKGIELVDVAYREPGTGRMLLDGLTLSVPAGKRAAVVFADPAEGRAFGHLLSRFADPTGGEVRLDGKNVRWLTAESVRTQVNVVAGDPLTYSDTVAHNVGCGEANFTLPRIIEAAKLAHAHQFVQKLPYGYETLIGTGGVALRPGERFRIALARAALRDPSVLVVGEPDEPLDPDSRALADDALTRLAAGRTLVYLTRRPETIRSADVVYVVSGGRVAAGGKPDDLLADGELFRLLR